MTESTARKILGLKAKKNPCAHMAEFRANLKRKQGFVDNSPSEETKARYQAELHEYQEAYDVIEHFCTSVSGRGRVGLMVCLILIIAAGVGGWWVYDQNQQELHREAQRKEEEIQQQIHIKNLERIAELEESGKVAVIKRKWAEAQQAYDGIKLIDSGSAMATAGFEAIRLGKLEERNQKIFYILGNSQAALEAGQWDDARKLAQSVLTDNPGHTEAIAKLQSISKQRSAHEISLSVRAVSSSLESGDLIKAQEALVKLKKLSPNHQQIPELSQRIDTALAALQARQLKAVALLTQAKQLDQGQFSAKAIILLDEATLLDPDNPEVKALHHKISNYTRTIQVPEDFASIAEALASARPRDRIRVAPGTYRESLSIDKAVRLEGSADGKTVIEFPADEAPVITIQAAGAGAHLSGLTIKHIGFDYGKDRSSAVIVQGGESTLNACEITHAAGHGIAVIDGAKVSILGCQISDSGWDGISVYGVNSRADIRDTTSQKNLQQGVGFWKGGYGSVTGSRMLANGLCGILAMSPNTQINIQTTLCARNRGAGILVSDQVKATITAVRCDKNLLSGIVARGVGTTASVINSVTTGNGEAGILIHRGVKREAFSGNQSTTNKKRQIWLDAALK